MLLIFSSAAGGSFSQNLKCFKLVQSTAVKFTSYVAKPAPVLPAFVLAVPAILSFVSSVGVLAVPPGVILGKSSKSNKTLFSSVEQNL